MEYIIDGYNVVHKIAQLNGQKLRYQREGLIAILELAQLNNKCLRNLTLVFDAKCVIVAPKIQSTVNVIFSGGISADQKIKRMVKSSTYARDISVVSDDRQVRSQINALGAKKLSVESFLKLIYSSTAKEGKQAFKISKEQKRMINQELEKTWFCASRKEG